MQHTESQGRRVHGKRNADRKELPVSRRVIQKTAWKTRTVLTAAFTTYPASAFAQSVRSGWVPPAYVVIGGIAIIAIIFAVRRLPKRSEYRREWKFTCPRCNTHNSSETPAQCRNCANGVIKASYFRTQYGGSKASFGCSHCEKMVSAPRCSCGAEAGNRMQIMGRLSWLRPDSYY